MSSSNSRIPTSFGRGRRPLLAALLVLTSALGVVGTGQLVATRVTAAPANAARAASPAQLQRVAAITDTVVPTNTVVPTVTVVVTPTAVPTLVPTNTVAPTATVTATAVPATPTATSAVTATAVPPPATPVTPTVRYFAEGYTGRFVSNGRADFNESISVLNSDAFTKPVTFTYQIQGSSTPLVKTIVVGPHSDVLESVNGDVGADLLVSAQVESPYRISAERRIDRVTPNGRLDSDSSLGNTAPGKTWYFAEGYAGQTFQEYLTVQNPGAAAATITVTFLPQGAPPSLTQRTVTFSVAAHSRGTENIRRDYLAFPEKSVALIVTSDQPVVTERVLYFGDGVGSAKFGATAKAGVATAGTQFTFAYGSNPGSSAANAGPGQQPNDEGYVVIANPAAPSVNSDASVTVTFYAATGAVLATRTLGVPAGTRETLIVNQIISPVAGPYYTTVASDLPVVVEKPQYLGGSPNIGRHPGVSPSGSPAPTTAVAFPSLSTAATGGAPISQTVFLVNLSGSPVTVLGTYYAPNGQTVALTYALAAHQLRTISVNADAGSLPAGPLGALYTSADGAFVAAHISNTPDFLSFTGNEGVSNP